MKNILFTLVLLMGYMLIYSGVIESNSILVDDNYRINTNVVGGGNSTIICKTNIDKSVLPKPKIAPPPITTTTWNGSNSFQTEWNQASNWSNGVPTSSTNVIIPSNLTYYPYIASTTHAVCNSLTIEKGASLYHDLNTNSSTQGSFAIYGDLSNNGTFSGPSSNGIYVILQGYSKTIRGNGSYSNIYLKVSGNYSLDDDLDISKLLINQSTASLSLSNNTCRVREDFSLSSGTLNLNTGILDLSNNFTYTSGTLAINNGTIYYSGDNTQNVNTQITYYNLEIEVAANTQRNIGAISTTNLEISNTNSATTGSGTLTLTGNLDLAGSLTINTDCILDDNGRVITLAGDWINNGSYTSSGEVVFLNTSNTSNPAIYGATTFNNLTINVSGHQEVNSDIFVKSDVILKNGWVLLTGLLSLDVNATISGGGVNRYISVSSSGNIRKYMNKTGAITFPFGDASGYTPFTFDLTSMNAISSVIPYITINVYTPSRVELSSTSYIDRNWEIKDYGFSNNFSYDVSYIFNSSDVVGNIVDILPTKLSSTGDIFQSPTPVNATTNTVTLTGLTSFSTFGAKDLDESGNLPISLIYFKGEMKNNQTFLKWGTASEKNNAFFEIQHSIDAIHYNTIGKVVGSGNSNTEKPYSFVDNKPNECINYYRLKQVDFDGKYQYSKIVVIDNAQNNISISPNPVIDILIISCDNFIRGDKYQMIISDLSNNILVSQIISKQVTNVDISNLPAGLFFVSFIANDRIIKRKIIKL